MKDVFVGYYSPTAKEYDVLWKEGIIVPDTNVLLDLYRLPPTARDELMAVLAELKERLWIPYQVGLEFQRQRLTVITAERKATEGALESARSLVGELKRKVEALQIEKHGLGLDPSPLIADLEQANAKLIEAIAAVHKQQPEIAASDSIRDHLDQILSNKIGPGPATQAELDELTEGAEQRYLDKIPPGYADSDKDKNPNFATFFHDGIRYQRKLGDLIMWRQLISFVKTNKIKSVLLVTAEQKEDWWWKEQGKIIGAQPELVREIYRDGGVNLFWIYSSVQFLKYAKSYVNTKVSDQAVAELQEISANPRRSIPATIGDDRLAQEEEPLIQGAVHEWLSERHDQVIETGRFPPLLKSEWAEMRDPAPPRRRTHGGTVPGRWPLSSPCRRRRWPQGQALQGPAPPATITTGGPMGYGSRPCLARPASRRAPRHPFQIQ